jgi:hypothetical protein
MRRSKYSIAEIIKHVRIEQNVNNEEGESAKEFFIREILIESVWLQGVVVALDDKVDQQNIFTIDDGTACMSIVFTGEEMPKLGDYVIIRGVIAEGIDSSTNNTVFYIDASLLDTINDPNMETLWFAETMIS